jgi:hypothetical protein
MDRPRVTLRNAWDFCPPRRAGSPRRVDVDALPLPFDQFRVDYDCQFDDSHGLNKSFRYCGRAGATLGILRRKQHPAAVHIPRVICIGLANDSPVDGCRCYLSCPGSARAKRVVGAANRSATLSRYVRGSFRLNSEPLWSPEEKSRCGADAPAIWIQNTNRHGRVNIWR